MFEFIENLDHQLFVAMNRGPVSPLVESLCWLASIIGEGIPLLLIIGLSLWRYDKSVFKGHFVWLLTSALLSYLLLRIIKYSIGRPRPVRELASLIEAGVVSITIVGQQLRNNSFPSGHVQIAATIFTYMGYLYPRRWYLWIAVVVAIGLSRVYGGAHFPADVLGGVILGVLPALVVIGFRQRGNARREGELLVDR
jgi:undecaprenyl-diphosphatase